MKKDVKAYIKDYNIYLVLKTVKYKFFGFQVLINQ